MLPLQYLTRLLILKFERADISSLFSSFLYNLFWLHIIFLNSVIRLSMKVIFLETARWPHKQEEHFLVQTIRSCMVLKAALKFFRNGIFYKSWFIFCGFGWPVIYPFLAAKVILTTNEIQNWEIIAWSWGDGATNDWVKQWELIMTMVTHWKINGHLYKHKQLSIKIS